VARPVVPDTSVFIQLFSSDRPERAILQAIASGELWLSSCVLAELYAGTRSREEARLLDRLVVIIDRLGRILTPTAEEWVSAGRLIGRRIRLAGSLRPRDHLADVVILVSSARLGARVLTANLRHLEAWAKLARDAGIDIVVEAQI
jgi:predicted nucleic acid-binding protein